MTISRDGCFDYHVSLKTGQSGEWVGVADDGESECLLGSGPSVAIANDRVTLTRRSREGREPLVRRVDVGGGEVLNAVLRDGDRLRCWREDTCDIGVSVSRGGSLVLAFGALGRKPGGDITIDHDPRAEVPMLARRIRFLERPGTRIVWLDPSQPIELEAQLRDLSSNLDGVKRLAIVVRSDDDDVRRELNWRTMVSTPRGARGAEFLEAPERFSSLDEWLQYGRALSTERPRDLWMRFRAGASECLVTEGATATFEGWMVHVRRVFEPGIPGRMSQLGLAREDAGITPEMLERSTAAVGSDVRWLDLIDRAPDPRV